MDEFYKTCDELQKLREIARQRGGKCTSTEYISAKKKVSWKCSLGHEWNATPSSVKQGNWCPCKLPVYDTLLLAVFDHIHRKRGKYKSSGKLGRPKKYDYETIYKELQKEDHKSVALRHGCSKNTIRRILHTASTK